MGIWSSPPDVPSGSSPVHRCIQDQLGHTSAVPDGSSRSVDKRGTWSPYHLGDEGSSVSLDHLQGSDHGRLHGLDEWQCHGGGLFKKTGRHCFLSYVQSDAGDTHMGRAVHDLPHSKVHSGGEEPSHQPAQSSGLGASNQVVFSSSCVWVCLQRVRSFSH